MKNSRKFICSVLCLALFAFLLNSAVALETKYENSEIEFEQKIYSRASIDEDFYDSSVLVIMDKTRVE